MEMWNLITIDSLKQTTTTGSPQYVTHDKFHHTFTLPLWNKFAPLTINHHHNNYKEFPEFKASMIVERNNYLNQDCYDRIDRIMGKQQNRMCVDFNVNPQLPTLKQQQQVVENEKIDKNHTEKQQQQIEKKKKRRRRKNRNNKRNKNKLENNDNKSIKIETKLQRCNSLNNIKLIKNQRQRQISTDSDDSFIVFYDNHCNINDNVDDDDDNDNLKNSSNTTSAVSDKKVRFADGLCEIHPMVKWSYAYQAARKGPWEQYARDRDRFKKRIKHLEKILLPILNEKHRTKIYQERFN